jgi:8-oxo-dGTP diphosphatase
MKTITISKRELYPTVLVDIALFSVEEGILRLLLVRRSQAPEAHRWALPGGILEPTEDLSLEAAARRVLRKKVSVDVPHLEEVRTFSGPDRDPRGWSISILFYALLPRDQVNALIKDKVEKVEWVAASAPGRDLAFDHDAQIAAALDVLRNKVERHALPLHLMPENFTLTDLQRTCEAILERSLDKGVFRRRIRESPALVPVDKTVVGAHRPAQLYRACDGFTFMA